jgi:hypothetical protein
MVRPGACSTSPSLSETGAHFQVLFGPSLRERDGGACAVSQLPFEVALQLAEVALDCLAIPASVARISSTIVVMLGPAREV